MDIQILDNGGKTPDRYCLIIDNRDVYTVGADPRSHQVPMYLCEAMDLDREEAGRLVNFEDLPKAFKKAIEVNSNRWFGNVSGRNRRTHQRLDASAPISCRHSSRHIRPHP
jgi:hypothetical protein